MRYLKSGTELGFEPRGPKLKTIFFFFNDLQIKKKSFIISIFQSSIHQRKNRDFSKKKKNLKPK